MSKKTNHFAIFLISASLGIIGTAQYHSALSSKTTRQSLKPELLAIEINQIATKNSKLRDDINSASRSEKELSTIANSSGEVETAIKSIINGYEQTNGTVAVSGKGVSIQVFRPLEQTEIVDLINVLRGLDTEAISLNGQRITIHTPITSSPETQTTTIEVIGNTETLYSALTTKNGIINQLTRSSADTPTVTKLQTITLPAANNNPTNLNSTKRT